jgi:tRNA threonylcarbamoyladenosine modification (KEOPS) complex Cgi121 subunit|tara:strand:+ start:175 stop:636 length:462 start_codon:yes stop_codon:yes gene_type:complete
VKPIVGSGHLKTENIEDIKSLINPNFALINPKVVCGQAHLKQAAYLADKAHIGGYNLSKDRSTEALLYLTAQRQISKAIEIGGITEQTTEVAWISFDNIPNKITEFLSPDNSIISHDKFDYSTINLDKKLDLSFDAKQKIVMTRTATLPVQPR